MKFDHFFGQNSSPEFFLISTASCPLYLVKKSLQLLRQLAWCCCCCYLFVPLPLPPPLPLLSLSFSSLSWLAHRTADSAAALSNSLLYTIAAARFYCRILLLLLYILLGEQVSWQAWDALLPLRCVHSQHQLSFGTLFSSDPSRT